MKKCKYCEAVYEGAVCPMCGYDESEESSKSQRAQAKPEAAESVTDEAKEIPTVNNPSTGNSTADPPAINNHAVNNPVAESAYPYGYTPGTGYAPQYPPYYGYAAGIPSPPKKKYTAGGFFLSLAKAAGHVAFYFAVMFGVSIAVSMAVSFMIAFSSGGNISPDAVAEYIMEFTTPINIFAGGVLIVCLALFFLMLKKNPAAEMGLNPTRWRYILYAAALGVAFQFIVTFTISLIPSVAEYYSGAFDEQYAAMLDAPLPLQIINVAIITPFVEEILFRGMIYGSLRKGMPKIAAAIIASVVFGVFHGNIVSMIYAAALSFIMIAVYEKTDSLFVTIAMHAALNGSSFIMGYIPESPVIILAVYALSIAVGVAAFVLLVHAERRSEEYTTQESMVR